MDHHLSLLSSLRGHIAGFDQSCFFHSNFFFILLTCWSSATYQRTMEPSACPDRNPVPACVGSFKEDLEISSKHYLTMKQLIAEQNLDAIAVRCWPEFPNSKVFQGWPYLALARLATEGVYIYLYILKRNLIF